MVGFESFKRERTPSKRDSKKVELKDLKNLAKGGSKLETFGPDMYQFVLGLDDLAEIRVLYGVLGEFN